MDASSTLAFSTNKLNEYNMADSGFIIDPRYNNIIEAYPTDNFIVSREVYEWCEANASEPWLPEPMWKGIQFASGICVLFVLCLLVVAVWNFLFDTLPNIWYRRAYGAWVPTSEAELEEGEFYIVLNKSDDDWSTAEYREGKWYTCLDEATWDTPMEVRSVFEFKAPKK